VALCDLLNNHLNIKYNTSVNITNRNIIYELDADLIYRYSRFSSFGFVYNQLKPDVYLKTNVNTK